MSKKTKTFLSVLLVLMLVLALALLVACNQTKDQQKEDEDTTEKVEATEGLLIDNSDFKVSSASSGVYKTYPSTPNKWTGAAMDSSAKYPKDVIAGAINLSQDKYNDNKSAWEGLSSTDAEGLYTKLSEKYSTDSDAINNILMIYMPKDTDDDDDDDSDPDKPNYGPTAYGYTSSNFTISEGKYYVFSVDVLTYNISGNTSTDVQGLTTPGARIYLASADYVEYAAIDTENAWKNYKVYFKGHGAKDSTLSVLLGLGKASSSENVLGITAGYAFFANVSLTEIEDLSGGKTAAEQYADAVNAELADNTSIKTSDLNTPNGKFDFGGTTIASSSSPSLFNIVTGESSDSTKAAPTAAERYNGIIDVSKWADNYTSYAGTIYKQSGESTIATNPAKDAFDGKNFENTIYSDTYRTTHVGSNVAMLSQQLMTAQGYKSSSTINIGKNTCYAISIDVLTYQIAGSGVTIALDGGSKDLKIKNISKKVRYDGVQEDGDYGTTGTWTTYTFYIQGNQYDNSTYTLTLWLGTDGTDKNYSYTYDKYSSTGSSVATTYHSNGTFATGWAFFDELKIKEITTAEFEDAVTAYGPATNDGEVDASADPANIGLVYTLYKDNLFNLATTYPTGSDMISADFSTNAPATGTYAGIDAGTLGTPQGFYTNLEDEDASTLPIINISEMKAGSVSTTTDQLFIDLGISNPSVPYELNDNVLMIYSKDASFYQYETSDVSILPNKHYKLSLWVKTEAVQSTSGAYIYLMKLDKDGKYTSSSSFTAINTEKTENDVTTNEWTQVTFFLRGGYEETTLCHLKITFGTGTRWTSTTLASGALFVANPSMTEVTHEQYNSAAGTYVKSVSFVTSNQASFTNGTFNEFDMKETTFPDSGKLADGDKIGTPASWTKTDSTIEDAILGTIQLADGAATSFANTYEHSTQTTALFGSDTDLAFDNIYSNATATSKYFGGPNLLSVSSLTTPYAVGYKSENITYTANTNYEISVWVKAIKTGTYSIYLVSDTQGIVVGKDDTKVYSTYFIHTAADDEEWTEYKFYLEVGSTNVLARIQVFLGIDEAQLAAVNVTKDDNGNFVKVADDGIDYTDLKSTGLILFDNITKHSKTNETYEPLDSENYRYISYKEDSFTPSATDANSLSTLSDPANWTATADESAEDKNSKYGIIYLAGDYIETRALADDSDNGYVSILGADIKVDDQTVTTEESAITIENLTKHIKHFSNATYDSTSKTLEDVKADFAAAFTIENSDEAIRQKNIECYKKEKAAELQKANWIKLSDITAKNGASCLVINNTAESAYKYVSASNVSLNSNKYYKVSIWVRTFGIEEGKGAYIYFALGEDEKEETTFASINTDTWTEYSYYIAVNDDAPTSPKVTLGLGKYSDSTAEVNTMLSGYVFFDSYTCVEIEKAEYDAAVASDTAIIYEVPEGAIETDTDDEEPDSQTPSNKFNLDNLWWMIPTILLGVAIIAVIVVFFVKKFKGNKKKSSDYESNVITGQRDNSQQVIDKKRDTYDKYKE